MLTPVEKPPPAPDLEEEKKDASPPPVSPVKEIKPLFGKVVKRGERIRKDEASASPGTQAKNATKPKLVVKFAVKKTTKEATQSPSPSPPPPPKTAKAEQAKGPSADSRQAAKASAKDQRVRKSVDVDLTNDELQELNSDGSSSSSAKTQQSATSKSTSRSLPIIRVLKDPQVELAGTAKQVPVQNVGQTRKKQSKVVWTLTMVKDQGKAAAVKGQPTEVSKSPGPMLGKFVKRSRPAAQGDGSDPVGSPTSGNSLPSSNLSPGGQRRNPSHLLWIPQKRRTRDMGGSSAAAVSPKPVGKQRRISKGAEGSPEEGAEAGRESGHEPSDQPAASSGDPVRRRRTHFKFKKRRGLFNKRRKPGVQKAERSPDSPVKHHKPRQRMVGYVYEPVISLSSENQLGQQGEETCTPENTELASTDATPSATPVVSGRSSRVIKTPKRFLDDERMAHLAPRNPLKKNGIGSATPDQDTPRSAGYKRRSQHHEGEGHATVRFQEDHSTSDAPRSKNDQALSPEEGKVKFYERLKKLTATLAQKREQRGASGIPGVQQGEEEAQEEAQDLEETQGPVRKRRRRRSKLTMEDIQSPGVVRKLAVHLNAIGATLPGTQPLDPSVEDNGMNIHILVPSSLPESQCQPLALNP